MKMLSSLSTLKLLRIIVYIWLRSGLVVFCQHGQLVLMAFLLDLESNEHVGVLLSYTNKVNNEQLNKKND